MTVQRPLLQPADTSPTALPEREKWLEGLVRKERHSKVRTGCVTCKERRLKCDEAKPSCCRCLKSKRICGGYKAPKPWLFRVSVVEPQRQHHLPETEDLLQDFLHHNLHFLNGYTTSVATLCSTLAPQMANEHSPIRLALVAVAARTKSVMYRWDHAHDGSEAEKLRADALMYYTDAISQLTKSQSLIRPEVFLVCGLLFTAAEAWPHKEMNPVLHTLSAFRLLLREPIDKLPTEVKDGMLPYLVFTGRNALAFSDDVPDDLAQQMKCFTWLEIPPPTIPESFTSPNLALECTEALLKLVLTLDDQDADFADRGLPLAVQYSAQLLQALQLTRSLGPASMLGYGQELLVHQRVIQIFIETRLNCDQSAYDYHQADFAYILYECEVLIERARVDRSSAQSKVLFPTMGFISPLFFVATRCRQQDIRRKAVKILHGLQHRERTWNSCVAAMLARFVIETEERHLDEDCSIPAQHRVILDAVVFDEAGEQIIVSYHDSPLGADSKTYQTSLNWKAKGTIDSDFECITISRKALRNAGYTGILLLTPTISCQCGNKDYAEFD